MEKININIKEFAKQEYDDLQASRLTLHFSGKSVTPELTNTLRRLAIDYVPSYAFHRNNIYIEKNTSLFNNDYMRLRLSQISIPFIMCDVSYLEPEYWQNIDYSNPNRLRHPLDTKQLEMYINSINNTNEVMNVTTNDVRIYENGIEVFDKFNKKYPHQLIQLRPGETFSCRMVSSLGVGKNNNIWASAKNSYHVYDPVDETNIKLLIESNNQFDEYEIMYKACLVLDKKLNEIKTRIINTYDKPEYTNTNKLKIVIENEDHTVGNILNTYLQLNKNVLFSGYSKPNLLEDIVIIKLQTIENDPFKEVIKTLDYILELFDNIKNQILKLGKKYITFNYEDKIENKNNKKGKKI